MHERLLEHPYRASTSASAEVVFVPFYAGLALLIHSQNAGAIKELESRLWEYLREAEPDILLHPQRYVLPLAKVANEFVQVCVFFCGR